MKRAKARPRKKWRHLPGEIEIAQANCEKQKTDLQAQLDEYMLQNRLTLEKVNTVHAILVDEFKKLGAGETDITRVSKKIAAAGSLDVNISAEQAKTKRLYRKKKRLTRSISGLKDEEKNLKISIAGKRVAIDFSNEELEKKHWEIEEAERKISGYIEDLTASRLIIEFLASPDMLKGDDLNRLLNLISCIRRHRLAFEYKTSLAHDRFTWELIMPSLSRYLNKYRDRLEEGREQLAYYLVPIFKDKVVFVSGYAVARMGKPVWELRGKM